MEMLIAIPIAIIWLLWYVVAFVLPFRVVWIIYWNFRRPKELSHKKNYLVVSNLFYMFAAGTYALTVYLVPKRPLHHGEETFLDDSVPYIVIFFLIAELCRFIALKQDSKVLGSNDNIKPRGKPGKKRACEQCGAPVSINYGDAYKTLCEKCT